MLNIGMQEMIMIFMIALLLFGPKKLPELGRTLGKALTEFRRAKNELKSTFESHMRELEKETQIESSPAAQIPAPYTYPYDDYGRYHDGDQGETSTEREPTDEQKAAIETNVAAGDPAAYGLKPDAPVAETQSISGTIARNRAIHSASTATDEDHRA